MRQLVEPFEIAGARTVLALLAIGASAVLAVGGYLRWVAVQRAVRRGEPLPPAPLVPVERRWRCVRRRRAAPSSGGRSSERAERSDRDEGLANERTALARWRTALAAVVAAGLIVRGAAGTVEAIVLGCIGGAALAVAPGRGVAAVARAHGPASRRSRGTHDRPVAAALLVLQVIALVVVL